MKFKNNVLYSLIIFAFLFLFFSCNKSNDKVLEKKSTGKFQWKNEISVSDIPDSPVSGVLNGKEIKVEYINFEKWRGPNDNVINFSLVKPSQNCGFIENFQGFTLTRKSGNFDKGEIIKPTFETSIKDLVSEFFFTDASGSIVKFGNKWCGAMIIESIDQNKVNGKIALCFNDEKRSWVAGKFEAIICNN
jgi:hypothetical protein